MVKKDTKKKVETEKKGVSPVAIIVIILIVFLVYIAAGSINRSRIAKRKANEETKVETKHYDVDVEKIDVDDPRVLKAMEGFQSFGLYEMAYQNDSFELEDMSRYYLIVAALRNVENEKVAYCIAEESSLKEPVTLDYLNERLHLVSEDSITMDDIKENSIDNGLTVGEYYFDMYSLHIVGDNIYIVGACEGYSNLDSPYYAQVVSAEVFGDYLNVYQKVAFGKMGAGRYDWYYSPDRDGRPVESKSENAHPNMDNKYMMYKIMFIKVGDNYIFQGMENRL